ncbi:MAG TPA: cyclase [Acidobacteria bacterium]|nr:cyclase [Acidobacteriota bacterium]
MYVPYDLSKVKVLDLSQNFSADSPAFAFYEGPTVKWVKRLAFEGVNAQLISSTNHIATHLDSPIHFYDPGPDIAGIPIDTLVGPACIVDISQFGIGDYQIYGPEHFEAWEKKTGITIERGDILVIHTGYHHYYNEDWYKVHNQEKPDLPKSFLKHPGPQSVFCDWILDRGIRWLAVDCIAADHPFNTNVRKARPDLIPEVEAAIGMPLDQAFPWPKDYQCMHVKLFPHGVFHAENVGGQIDEVLDQRVWLGCFPFRFKGGEAAFSRIVAFVQEK